MQDDARSVLVEVVGLVDDLCSVPHVMGDAAGGFKTLGVKARGVRVMLGTRAEATSLQQME